MVNLPINDPVYESCWAILIWWDVKVDIDLFFKQDGCNTILFIHYCLFHEVTLQKRSLEGPF